MEIILAIFMNLAVLASSFLITCRIFDLKGMADFLIAWFLFYFSQIVLTELVLGVLSVLNLYNVILFNSAILLIALVLTRKRKSSFNFLNSIKSSQIFSENRALFLLGCIIFVFATVKICVNLINPPFGWDDLNYHFTFPVEWIKHANLDNPIVVSDDPSPSYYPINGSLFFLWLILPLRNVFLADLGQVPFFLISFLAVYAISRKISLNKEASLFAASLFLIIPNFFKQLQIAYVDVMVAGLFLASLNFLFLLNKEYLFKRVMLFSIALGLLIGTKTVALPYSILLIIPFAWLSLKNINKAGLLIVSILIIFIFGGYSYVKNLIDTGNPLYPLDLKMMGRVIFNGVMTPQVYSAHFRVEDYALTKILFHEGMGAQTLIFLIPGIFLSLPLTLFKKKGGNPFFIYFLLLPFLLYLEYRYVIPLANTRYLYPLLGIGLISGFYLVSILKIPNMLISILVVASALASMAELAKRQELAVSIILTALLFFLWPKLTKITKLLLQSRTSISILLILATLSLVLLNADYNRNESQRYFKMVKYSGFWPDAARAWDWLNKNTTGNNIAYIGRPVPFPLYGRNFKNNVYYASVNEIELPKLHYFKESRYEWQEDFLSLHKNLEETLNYRGKANYSSWLKNILNKKTYYLFVYSLHQTKDVIFPLEDNWAKANKKIFEPVFGNETIHIYKILR